MNKCTSKKGGYSNTQCDAMKRCASLNTRSKAKGLFFSDVVNLENGEKLGVGITIESEQIPSGVYLNFCPFLWR